MNKIGWSLGVMQSGAVKDLASLTAEANLKQIETVDFYDRPFKTTDGEEVKGNLAFGLGIPYREDDPNSLTWAKRTAATAALSHLVNEAHYNSGKTFLWLYPPEEDTCLPHDDSEWNIPGVRIYRFFMKTGTVVA